MLNDCLLVFWVFIPAGIANMAPVFAAHLKVLKPYDTPMDFGQRYHGKRILGDHKTWRGLVAGIVCATAILLVQQWLVAHVSFLNWIQAEVDYRQLPGLLVGPLFALGVLGGDALKSFFKRQLNIAPGGTWFPFDQIDYIIGGAIAVSPFIRFTLRQYVLLLVVWTASVMITTYVGWLLKLKDNPI